MDTFQNAFKMLHRMLRFFSFGYGDDYATQVVYTYARYTVMIQHRYRYHLATLLPLGYYKLRGSTAFVLAGVLGREMRERKRKRERERERALPEECVLLFPPS